MRISEISVFFAHPKGCNCVCVCVVFGAWVEGGKMDVLGAGVWEKKGRKGVDLKEWKMRKKGEKRGKKERYGKGKRQK